jgi:DNA-directed RNA polymerase subunit RPC12/RpoP
MAAEFRCEKCMKIVSIDADPGSKVRCPHCGKKIVVPTALASLPTPQVPGDAPASANAFASDTAAPPPPPDGEGEGDEEEEEEEEEEGSGDAVMTAMAAMMPWVISLFLHGGLMLVMVFAVMIVKLDKRPDSVVIPDAAFSENPGGVVNPGESNPDMEARQPTPTDQNQWSRREGEVSADTGKTDTPVNLIGRGVGGMAGGGLAAFGLTTGGSGSGPRSDFYGSGGNAHHVVYVIDKSGSMIADFDNVRQQMLISISKLREVQDFHVILFADGPAKEYTPRKLVPANDLYKEKAAEWLGEVRPGSVQGFTDPDAALKRAFAVLAVADKRRPGKLIYLLTDGVFLDNAKILTTCKGLNRAKDVFVNTYLYGFKPPEAVKLMKQLAADNGPGRYKYVSQDE